MESNLLRAFGASLVADTERLREASAFLESIRSEKDVIQSCMAISLSESPIEIRQIAVIYLKNLVKVWKDSRRDYKILEEDKLFLRSNVINCLLFSIPDKIRVQYEEIAFNIAKADFPWDEILNQIDGFLVSNNADQVFAALSMINQIAKVYEQVLNEKRNNMKIIVSRFFLKLGNLLQGLLTTENPAKYRYISLVLQIYWTCFYIDLPEDQANIHVLQGWLEKCKQVLEMPMEELENQLTSEDEQITRDEHPKWQCKKWSAQIIHRFFNRYFNLAYLKDHHKSIGEYFQSTWAVPLTELALTLLLKIRQFYLPNGVSNYLIKFLTQAFKLESTKQVMQKFSTELIICVILPLILRKPSDEEMWLNNPIEYIRRESDIGKAYFSSKSSAVELLKTMCEHSCLKYFMSLIQEGLSKSPSLVEKEALIFALGSLNKVIKIEKSFLPYVENILYNSVLCEFTSSVGFLRSRACWVYSQFTDIQFKVPEHKEQILQLMCKLIIDSELPVRIEAATALPRLLSWDIAKEKIGPEIQNVLRLYLELMTQIDFEELVEALEEIVGNFAPEIAPFAIEFCTHLINAFLSIVIKENNEDSVMAAISTLNTLGKLIDTLDDRPEDLYRISIEIQKIFDYVFTLDHSEYFECTLTLLTSLLYYCPSNSLPHLFKYASMLKNYIIENSRLKDAARDSVEELFPTFANIIQKYRVQAKENLNLFLEIASIFAREGYLETATGCKLFMAILENVQLDPYTITQVLVNSYPVYTANESKKMKLLFVQIVFIALWRAPQYTMAYLKNLACIENIFEFICENYLMIKEEIPVIQSILGLSSLISISHEILEYSYVMPSLCKVMLMIIKRFYRKGPVEETKIIGGEGMNMMEKLKMMENDDSFEECGDDYYESFFETLDMNNYIKICLAKCAGYLHNAQLSEEEQEIVKKFTN